VQDKSSPEDSDRLPEITATRDCDAVAGILTEAFAEDPCFNWVIPHPPLHPPYWRQLASCLFLEHRMMFIDRDARAAALWLPPGAAHQVPVGPRLMLLMLRLVLHRGPQVLARIQQAQERMVEQHPAQPHYYLHAIGVRRDSQGMGLGSALLKHVTRRCDEEGLPAYLESSAERNVPLYERHGFEVTAELPIGRGGPPMYFMWREPRQ
jgi:GNAT superfamily N-acetyltransferase